MLKGSENKLKNVEPVEATQAKFSREMDKLQT